MKSMGMFDGDMDSDTDSQVGVPKAAMLGDKIVVQCEDVGYIGVLVGIDFLRISEDHKNQFNLTPGTWVVGTELDTVFFNVEEVVDKEEDKKVLAKAVGDADEEEFAEFFFCGGSDLELHPTSSIKEVKVGQHVQGYIKYDRDPEFGELVIEKILG